MKPIYKDAIAKWEWIVENWDYSSTVAELNCLTKLLSHPRFRLYPFACSFCEKYLYIHDCSGCPLSKKHQNCHNKTSLYNKWQAISTILKRKNAAKKLLKLLKEIGEENE